MLNQQKKNCSTKNNLHRINQNSVTGTVTGSQCIIHFHAAEEKAEHIIIDN